MITILRKQKQNFMKRKIKNLIFLFVSITFMYATIGVNPAQSQGKVKIPAPNDLRCKCHSGGECYGGNFISFRKKCANIQSGEGNCRGNDENCPG